MRSPGGCVLLLLLTTCARGQQQTGAPAGVPVPAPPATAGGTGVAPATATRIFRVHVVDGRNGAPVEHARVTLWYDESAGDGYGLVTGSGGVAVVPQPPGEPVRVLLRPDSAVDCRRPARDAPPTGFNLQQIARSGMAAENSCGDARVRPGPGELILYVRPRRWYEGLNQ